MSKWMSKGILCLCIFLVCNKTIGQLSVTGTLEATSFTGTGITINGTASFNSLTITGVTGIPGSFIGMRVFNTGTVTYSPTAGTKSIIIEMVGGGGGGGGASATTGNQAAGSGGGAGGYLRERIASVGAGPYTIQVGAAGAAGAATAGTGGNGTATIFIDPATTTYTASFGLGGIGMATGTATAINIGGAGSAVSSNGDINGAGAAGALSIRLSGTAVFSGNGGSTIFGGGGSGRTGTVSGAGAALSFGSGGGGAVGGAANQAGGLGGQGLLVIYEYK